MNYRSACGWVIVLAVVAPLAPAQRTAVAAPAPPAPAPSGPAYVIKLTRPVKVGDRARYVADCTAVRSAAGDVAGQHRSLRPESAAVRFEATEQVLAVNAQGEPTKASYKVDVFSLRDEKRSKMSWPGQGSTLTVEAGRWMSKIDVSEGSLTVWDDLILRRVVPIPALKGVTFDDCFGTPTPKRVGESWNVNPVAVARWVEREGVRVNPRDVSGTVKLKATQVVDGVPHLLVQGRVVVARWTPDPKDVPADMKLVECTYEFKFTKLLPTDLSGHCRTDSNSERALLKVRENGERIGPDLVVEVKTLDTVGITRTPLAPAPVADAGQ